jgi:hypothetical protein
MVDNMVGIHKKLLLLGGLLLGSPLAMQNVSGQYDMWRRSYPHPTERVNFFTSKGDEPNALAFNALSTEAERRAFGKVQMLNSFVYKIPPSGDRRWSCNTVTPHYVYEGNLNLWTPEMLIDGRQIYEGYSGEDFNIIYDTEGTNKFFRTTGLPAASITYKDYITIPSGHQSSCFIAGRRVDNAKAWHFQEVPLGIDNLQPGEGFLDKMDCDTLLIYYKYLYKDSQGRDNVANVPALWFTLKNGEYIYRGKSPYLDIIMERDTVAPVADVYFGLDNKLHYIVSDENFKSGILRISGLSDIVVKSTAGIIDPDTLGLPDGTYSAELFAEDYFRLKSSDATLFTINHTAVDGVKTIDDFVAYPNPFVDVLSVRGNRTSPVVTTADLISSNGQILRQFKLDFGIGEFNERLNVDGLLPGNYMLRVKSVLPDGKIDEDIMHLIKTR